MGKLKKIILALLPKIWYTIAMQTVYLETSVVSNLTARPSNNIVNMARQIISCDWWDAAQGVLDIYVSPLVAEEALKGDARAAERRMAFLKPIKALNYGARERLLARRFLELAALPLKSYDDALHIAIATYYNLDFLVTWNCKHICNPVKLPQIVQICTDNGLKCPQIVTPKQLLEIINDTRRVQN